MAVVISNETFRRLMTLRVTLINANILNIFLHFLYKESARADIMRSLDEKFFNFGNEILTATIEKE